MTRHLVLLLALLGLSGPALASPGSGGSAQGLLAPEATRAFLARPAQGPVWTADRLTSLLAALDGLARHGLDPAHYHRTELGRADLTVERRDLLATDAWLSAAAHLLYGKLDPRTVEPNWTAARREADLAGALTDALKAGSIQAGLEQLAPSQPGYAALLAEFAALRAAGNETVRQIPPGEALKPGMTGDRVLATQERLAQLGLLAADHRTGRMDEPTVAAIETLQTMMGLDADGTVGSATRAALNRGNEERLQQLRVNLERWRWLPADLGRRHVRANIAGFTLSTYEDGVLQRTHLTIVGKVVRKTPVFSDEIEYMVFNPWWETPDNLARADKLPAFKRDPASVDRLGFQVLDRTGQRVDANTIDWAGLTASTFPYRLRQAPGDQNALGQVKIIFPNPYNVYIHDTPTRGLFAQQQRAFSSGCMRTQDPIGLATWLLEETPGWDRARIDGTVRSGKETRATLKERVPVHILYFTVVADQGGAIRYLDDVYGRDPAVRAGLDRPPGGGP